MIERNLDKTLRHGLIDLERLYSDVPWTPIVLSNIVLDNVEQLLEYFKNHTVLEIYSSKVHSESVDLVLDGPTLFPNLCQQIFQQFPFREIFFIHLHACTQSKKLSKDQSWSYNLPLSFRSILYDENDQPTSFVQKINDTSTRSLVELPNDTNTFAINHGAFYSGEEYYGKNKIILKVEGIPDIEKLNHILSTSIEKYKPNKIYNQSQRYTVYNLTIKEENLPSPHPPEDIVELYRILLTSPDVVNVEEFISEDSLKTELRVIFWNQDSYYNFAATNQERYQAISRKLENNYLTDKVHFERHTSSEDYQSEFPETKYPDATSLINWTLIKPFKTWFIDNIIPMGRVIDYVGNGEFSTTAITTSRFFKERTSNILRLPPSTKSSILYPDMMAYNFDQAIRFAIFRNPYVYHRFNKLCTDIENMAETYIKSCENAAVLIGHESLGQEITLHTHRVSDQKKLTMTFIIRITFDDQPLHYKFYPVIEDDDPNLPYYYTQTNLLLEKTNHQTPHEIISGARSSMLVFNASYTPHTVIYNKDIYMFFVYDNVEFHEGALEKIQNQSQQILFSDKEPLNRLYFYDFTN